MIIKVHDGIEYAYELERFWQNNEPGNVNWRAQFLVKRVSDNVPAWTYDLTGEGLLDVPLTEIYSLLEVGE